MPSGEGLGVLKGRRPPNHPITSTPPSSLIAQLKVPVEEPAGELPMNEIEAWKAAEKVGLSYSL